ncbi:MAG: hypothetical protein R3F46_06120 [bacterium]
MRYLANLVVMLMVVFICSGYNARAAEQYPEWHPDYPGNGPGDSHVYIGMQSVKLGVFYFRKVYERWPESWQEVRDSGIFQADIPGFDLVPLNPDNPDLTDYGQVYYEAPEGPGSNPVVHTVDYMGGFHILHEPANGYMTTYRLSFQDYDNKLNESVDTDFRYSSYLENESQLKQFAILGIMTQNIGLFRSVNGRLPYDMQEFMSSGFSPVDSESINPVTGQPFRFDGSVGDARYEIMPDGNFRLRHVESVDPGFGFTY